jgi:hypothetical protein
MILASAGISAQALPPPAWIEIARGENISFSEATWELFQQVAESKGNESTLVEELPARLRLDEKGHRALFAHIKSAVSDSAAHSTSLRKAMCGRRAEMTTIERVAAELDRIDLEVANHRDKLMIGAGSILGVDGTARLEPVVLEVRGQMALPRIDYVRAMRDRKESAAAVMTRLCAEFK